MESKFLHVPFELKSIETKGEFVGYGSTFGNADLGDDIVVKGAFDRTLKAHAKSSTMPAMLFGHDMNEPIGHWVNLGEDSKGLRVEGKLWLGQGIPKAEQAYAMLSNPGMKGLSIGYKTVLSENDKKSGTRRLVDVDLFEISPVVMPMNEKALITNIKSLKREGRLATIREFEQLLRDVGLSQSEAKAFCAEGYKSLHRDGADDNSDDLASIARAIEANITRLTKGV